MNLADINYANSLSGYVNTGLLGLIGAGSSYIFKGLTNGLKKVSENQAEMQKRQAKTDIKIAILMDRDVKRHGGLSGDESEALRDDDD